jgi:hypothetical protein
MRSAYIALAVALVLPSQAVPCASIGAAGAPVATASETAVIAWDSERHIEHFIRSADFVTGAKSIGFLVPTPSAPKLAEASAMLFQKLSTIVATHRKSEAPPATKGIGTAGTRAGVQVLSQETVSGFDASVLKAGDAKAVKEWLATNGYPVGPDTEAWLEGYLSKGWTITAFKVASKSGAGHLRPVHMSFEAETPIYPYREPAGGTPISGRTLRVFLLGNGEFDAKLHEGPWSATREWSGALNDHERAGAATELGVPGFSPTHLTSFLDRSSPRDGTADIFFEEERSRFGSPWLLLPFGAMLTVLFLRGRSRRTS